MAEHDEELNRAVLAIHEDDSHSTVHLEISAGVGGAEAQLFASEIFHMYANYVEYKGWSMESVQTSKMNENLDDKIRKVTVVINGPNAFRTLKLEAGVHRVQRIPATEKSGRIHTSTVTVAVVPQPDDFGMYTSFECCQNIFRNTQLNYFRLLQN